MRLPVKRLPFKIKRIPSGQTSGMALISANVAAFESYGLEASLIAPTCQECGERFSKAANALIEDESTHLTIGPLVYLFWTREAQSFSLASLLSNPEPEAVRSLLSAAIRGTREAARIDEIPFYATAFAASGGRVAVRDWLDSTVGEVKRHVARYFALQNMVDRDGSAGKPLGLYALAAATVRDASKELPPNVPGSLLQMVLKGGPLPNWLLFHAVKRNRAEQGITRPRAALIRMVLLSRQGHGTLEDTMIHLDPGNHNPAYLCGRLFALLEAVQRAAMPRTNTTITDRFFGTASSAPASVFGRFLRGAQAHLNKLRKERRGTYEALQRRLEDIQKGLAAFPRTLTLEEQGLFSLGYYHQRAHDRAAAIAYRQGQGHENMDLESTDIN
jgi:CRISPR-associated protein Csd1